MLSLIIKQIREYFRSPANVFMGLLFPVLLVFFLGTMLQNLDIADYDIGEIKLQYSVTQTDEQGGKAFAEFLDNISMIKAEKASDEKTALSLTDKGDIDAYIELKNGEILLYCGRNEIANRALGSVLNSFIAVSDTYYEYRYRYRKVICRAGRTWRYTEYDGLLCGEYGGNDDIHVAYDNGQYGS